MWVSWNALSAVGPWRRRRAVAAAAAIVAMMAIAGCSKTAPSFNNVDITGAAYARDFSLTDHTGKRRALADFRGNVVVVFFGFTQCPDVCPTTLTELAQIKQQLGKDGENLRAVFITIDPARDTQQLLAAYVTQFDQSFTGLYGTDEEIARCAREFKVFYQKVPGKTPSSYSMDHTAGSYVFDKQGKIRLFLRPNQPADLIVADLKKLL